MDDDAAEARHARSAQPVRSRARLGVISDQGDRLDTQIRRQRFTGLLRDRLTHAIREERHGSNCGHGHDQGCEQNGDFARPPIADEQLERKSETHLPLSLASAHR
jgi:hypothetical protein